MPGAELIALFGDELSEIDSARVGVRVASGQKVSARDLAWMLLAASVAELAGGGLATLEQAEVKKMFRTKRVLTVWSRSGAEGFARTVANVSAGGCPVGELGLRLLGGRVISPEMALIDVAKSLLVPTGAVVEASGRAKRFGAKLGMSPYEIDAEKAEQLRGDWQRVKVGWETWKGGNPSLASELEAACRKAVAAAKEPVD